MVVPMRKSFGNCSLRCCKKSRRSDGAGHSRGAKQVPNPMLQLKGDLMAKLEPGHPDELVQVFRNWLREADSPIGALPAGVDAVEWAVRRFIDYWKTPARNAIERIEESLCRAMELCDAGTPLPEIK